MEFDVPMKTKLLKEKEKYTSTYQLPFFHIYFIQ